MPTSPSSRNPLTTGALLATVAVVACDGGRAPAVDDRTPEEPPAGQETTFVVRDDRLVRRGAGGSRPLLALDAAAAPPGVPSVPLSWRPAPDVAFRIGATEFRHVVPSPDGRRVAWEAGSTHDLLGVVPADGGPITVLDFFFDASAEELSWAPGGRYLLARHRPPSGLEEARVYDVEAGTRLRTPWGESCRARDGCRVTSAAWTDGTTLSVTTTDGRRRHRRVDVSGLPAASSSRSGGEG